MKKTERVLAWKLSQGTLEIQPVMPGTLDDACRRLPGGAYTTLRTYHPKRALFLSDHFRRLEESAALSGLPVSIDHARLRSALRFVLNEAKVAFQGDNPVPDFRIRIVLDLESQPGDLYLVLAALTTPSTQEYKQGVAVILSSLQRALPGAKLTSFINMTAEIDLPPGVNEALLLDKQGCILEGMSSNFYAIIHGILFTAGEGILPGLTRSLVLEVAGMSSIPLNLQAPGIASIPEFSEAFLTSTSRGVLPVREIADLTVGAGQVIGSGKPGPLTRTIARLYQERVQQLLEEI